VPAVAELEQGRESYAKRKWVDAYESLAAADETTPLSAEDLELLARSGYMLGRDDDYVSGPGARSSRLPGGRRAIARGAEGGVSDAQRT
jgi:hypothetical protein